MVKLQSNMEIKDFLGDIKTDEETLKEHSRDRSIFSITPKAIVYPKNSDDILKVLKKAKEEKTSVSIRAGGTCMSGGSLDHGYILNLTKYINKVEIHPEEKIAVVETGAYFRDIEDKALEHGLMFPPYPSSHRICGIGGMLGNNASGEQSVRYGATIDNVISLEVLLSDGTKITTGPKDISDLNTYEHRIFSLFLRHSTSLSNAQGKVTKVASGYRLDKVVKGRKIDLTPLFIGAQGTLGIITKATLKLVSIPKYHELVLVSASSIEALPELLHIAKKHNPECVETFDINTYKASALNMQKEVKKVSKYILDNTKLSVLIQFSEDTAIETKEHTSKFLRAIEHLPISPVHVKDEKTRDALWALRRASYTEIQNLNKGSFKAVPCIEDIIVPVENISKLIFGLEVILERNKIIYGFHGHIGEGSLRIIPFFDLKDPKVGEQISSLMREVFSLVKECNGNMCADHSDGIIRSPFLKEFYGEKIFEVFKEIKQIFDPQNLLNPKKKTGGLEEYIESYIAYP
jgi:FAD/FMN-containing dehydrogenase